MCKSFHPVLLGTLLLTVPPLADDGSTAQTGTFGQIAPQSADVRLADAIPHQDDHGGTLQQLVCAAGSKAGFALLWRDLREGMMGLYLGRFDHDAHMREPEHPVHQPYAGRRLQPGLCLDAEGGGVALWTADFLNVPVLYAHVYDPRGQWQGPDQALTETPQQMHERSERTSGVQLPAAAPFDEGRWAVAWTMRGALMWAEVKRDGTGHGEAQRLNPREQQADPGVQLCGAGKKSPLAVWHADGRLWSLSLGTPKAAPHDLGPGTLIRSVAADDGGAWILLAGEKGSSARRLHADGRPDGEALAVCEGGEQALDIALLGSSLAVLVQTQGANAGETPGRGRGGRTQPAAAGARFQLRMFDGAHSGHAQPIDFLSDKAKIAGTPLVASDGARLLLAWTDTREGDADVYARLVAPGAENALGPEFRANTDRASADQGSYRVDASGSAGVVTWIDKRDSAPRAYARRIAAPGSFQGDEFVLPGQDPKAAPGAVAPALRPDGSCAFLWSESSGALRLAVRDPAGKPLGETLVLVPEGAHDCAIAALPAEQGWLCAWTGSEPAVWALRVDPAGQPVGGKQRLSRESATPLNNLSVCFLGGRRLAVAWDTNDGAWKIRGRFTGLDGAPLGDEFELEGSPRHQDWDPALAPTGNGGFLAAWTSGAPDDGSRDVVARFFDGQARPSGPLLWISPTNNEQDNPDVVRLADGTWAVGWEDDISGYDNTYVRRIHKDQRQVGPVMRINQLETKSIQDRVAPRLAPLADGLLCAFGDRSRSLGWDVRVRIVGPKFDVLEKH
jgi:hypothetical protein